MKRCTWHSIYISLVTIIIVKLCFYIYTGNLKRNQNVIFTNCKIKVLQNTFTLIFLNVGLQTNWHMKCSIYLLISSVTFWGYMNEGNIFNLSIKISTSQRIFRINKSLFPKFLSIMLWMRSALRIFDNKHMSKIIRLFHIY